MRYEATRQIDGWLTDDEPVQVHVFMSFEVGDASFDHAFGTKQEVYVDLIDTRLVFELNGKYVCVEYPHLHAYAIDIDDEDIEAAISSTYEETYEKATGY